VWWKEALGAFSDRPVAGYGAGSFPVVHLQYRKNLLAVRQPHDVPLEFLSETGIVGGVLGVGAIAALLVAAAAGARRRGGLAVALLAAGSAWAAHALVDWDWDIPGVTVPALVALGVVAAAPGRGAPTRSRPGLLAAAGLTACLYLVSVALPAWSQSKAGGALAAAREDATPGQLQSAAAAADLASRLDPLDVDSLFAAAAIADRRGRLLEERRVLLDAVGRQPSDAGAWERLALLAVRLGDREGAVRASYAALKLDPRNARLRKLARDALVFAAPPQDSPTATGTPLT
jgi:tetratricopeptide (TPR) repeat protein